MKKKLLTGVFAAFGLFLGLTSCGDESSALGDDLSMPTGHISPKVAIDASIISASIEQASRANEDVNVTVSQLKLKLTSDDGSFSQEWESVNDFDETQDFKVGNYTLEAYYGDESDAEGYSKPHFHGSQDIAVKYDRTTEVDINAELRNSRVFVRYTDAFRDYMKSYSVQIVSPKGKYIDMPSDETNPVYVTPGNVKINLSFTRPDGKNANIEAANFDAKAKTQHVVTIDIDGGDPGADAVLKVIFDSTVDAEDVNIDLSDDLIDAPAPVLTPEGWTSGQTFPLIEFSSAPNPIKANIIAHGKISSVTLTTTSPSLLQEGWPNEIDLVKANEATQAKLTSLGLKTHGIWKNPDTMGVIDFTDVFKHIGVSTGLESSTHSFTIQVKDRYSKLSEVYEFTVVSSLGHIEIISATAEIGRKTINAVVEYDGTEKLSDVKFMKRNLLGAWDNLTASNIQPVAGKPGTYTITLTAPNAIEKSLTLRAAFISNETNYSDIEFEVTTPPFVLIASDNDVFAHRATFTVKCDDADDALVARNIAITLNGKTWDNYKVNGADIQLSKLKEGTKYAIEASSSNHSASAEITTETEEHLPGCNHDAGDDHSVGFATSGWKGVRKAGSKDNDCVQFLWSYNGWATMNELTVSEYGTGTGSAAIIGGCSYKATSGTIPANGRSTQSFVSGGGFGTSKHFDGHTVGNPSLLNGMENSGTNAALIRTVGWGKGNTAHIGTSSDQGFGTCQNKTPGELYLGEYNNGPQYGIEFTSRPSAVTFYYHYDVKTSGNGDYGTAEITVYSVDGQIVATGSKKLTECGTLPHELNTRTYVEEKIPLTYAKGAAKAAKLSIIFRSTDKNREDNPALKENHDFWHTPGGNNTSGGEYVGSELYIDDVSLIY